MNRERSIHLFCYWLTLCLATLSAHVKAGTYAMIESTFDVPGVVGNPFDFLENDVKVTLAVPGGSKIVLPAFYDGSVWRVRHTPTAPGRYEVASLTRNGVAVVPKLISPKSFDVAGQAAPGFIRIDPANKFRFVHDDGSLYYPIGMNHAWRVKGNPPNPTIPESIATMGSSGMNWVRVWMNHWDLKNLDWIEDVDIPPGQFDMNVAKSWDQILKSGETNNVYVQIALQHHGQYSTRADANWQINPWNKANGGWLENAVDFFTDAKAKKLTQAKYRYIIARYGYSPAIMAWELFNEVEGTDAYSSHFDSVVAWHNEMAAFIRANDPYKHLITTSSRTTDKKLWPAMDYYNAHVYAPDIVTAIQTLESEKLDRAYFYGEIGSAAFGTQIDPAQTVHECLWASLMSQSSGAAQYWYWDLVEAQNLFTHFRAASAFLKQSQMHSHADLRPIEVLANTPGLAPLRFGPGTGWAASTTTHFDAKRTGFVDGVGGMSAYLQGTLNAKNVAMFPFAELKVNFETAGTFKLAFDEYTPDGAVLNVMLDGKPATSMELFAPPAGPPPLPGEADRQHRNPRVNASISIPVPAGEHLIRLENTGKDWIHLRQFTLDPYAPQLAVLGKGSDHFAALWVYRRELNATPVDGVLQVPGLMPGRYRVTWVNTQTGEKSRSEVIESAGPTFKFATGPIQTDAALWIETTTDAATTRPVD